MEVTFQNGYSRRGWEKEGSEPENIQRSSCFWEVQIVSVKASDRHVSDASGRCVGLPGGTGRANGGNSVHRGDAAEGREVRAHGSFYTDAVEL